MFLIVVCVVLPVIIYSNCLLLQVTSLVGRHVGVLFDFCAYEGADAGVFVTALSCDAYIYASS